MIGAGGGGSGFFLLIILAFGFLWLVLVRPQKKRQLAQQRMLDEIKVGDQVVTAGGIYGEVTQDAGDDVMVRIAPDIEVRVARRAIGGVIAPHEPDEPDKPDEENPAEPGTLSEP